MKHAFLVLLLLTPSATIAQEPPEGSVPLAGGKEWRHPWGTRTSLLEFDQIASDL
jgi:hypothetical protein